jgi:uncharacterized protein (TIGR03066 family)
MKTLLSTAVALLLSGVAVQTTTAADAKVDAKKIVGVWEGAKGGEFPPGATIEFTKDGKVKVSLEANGKKVTVEGTYKVAGDKLTVTMKGPGGKEKTDTDTIKTLTDDKLVIHDAKEKKNVELKKKKK